MNAGTMKLLLHSYVHPPDVPFPLSGTMEFQRECRQTLFLTGLIDELGAITDRGRTHIEAVLRAPLPEQKWVSPL